MATVWIAATLWAGCCGASTARPTVPSTPVPASAPAPEPSPPPQPPTPRPDPDLVAWRNQLNTAFANAAKDLETCRALPDAEVAPCICGQLCALIVAPPPGGLTTKMSWSYGGGLDVAGDGTILTCRWPEIVDRLPGRREITIACK
jgi:hypothetical protein